MLASFVVTTELQFYYIPTSPFLEDMGAKTEWLTGIKTVAQIAEVFVLLFLLHVSIKKFGVRITMVIGIMAWPIRYFLFMVPNLPVIIFIPDPPRIWLRLFLRNLSDLCEYESEG